MKLSTPLLIFRRLYKKSVKTLQPNSLLNRRILLVALTILLLAGAGTFYSVSHRTRTQNTVSKTPPETEKPKEVLTATDSSTQPQNTTQTPPASSAAASTTQTPTAAKSKTAASSLEIIANIPRTSFRIGEDSGTITLSTSTGAPVAWAVRPQPSISSIYLANENFAVSASTTFTIKTKLPPTAVGPFSIAVDAYSPDSPSRSRVATKVLVFNILPQQSIKIDVIDEDMELYDDGTACTPYQIVKLVDNVIVHNVGLEVEVVSGDPTGLSFDTGYPGSSPYLCIGISPDTTPGQRVIRLTAGYNAYTTSDDFIVDVIESTD